MNGCMVFIVTQMPNCKKKKTVELLENRFGNLHHPLFTESANSC